MWISGLAGWWSSGSVLMRDERSIGRLERE